MKNKLSLFHMLFRKNQPVQEEAPAPDPFAGSRCGEKPVVIYFAPHQDDELLTLGVDACRTISSGDHQVHVVLCADGSKSKIRLQLCNGKECRLHPGIHQYTLDIPQFIAARDREFRSSCDALGYSPDAIHYYPRRTIDFSLSVEAAEAIIRSVLAQFPEGVAVRTISPCGGNSQHSDHRNLGLAAVKLYREGLIRDLKLFIEPYCVESCKEAYPDLELIEMRATDNEKEHIARAIRSYSTWDPDRGNYAIGYHSVTTIFNDFMENTAAWYHLPEAVEV